MSIKTLLTRILNWIGLVDDYVVGQGTISMGSGSTNYTWTYRRWNSGIAECWMTYMFTTAKATTAWGSLYYGTLTSTFEFPTGLFTAAPQIETTLRSAGGRFWASHSNDASATAVGTIYNLAPQAYTGNSVAILNIHDYGTWK